MELYLVIVFANNILLFKWTVPKNMKYIIKWGYFYKLKNLGEIWKKIYSKSETRFCVFSKSIFMPTDFQIKWKKKSGRKNKILMAITFQDQ